jgi:hypothetical protein
VAVAAERKASAVDGVMATLQTGDRIPMSWTEYEALFLNVRGE